MQPPERSSDTAPGGVENYGCFFDCHSDRSRSTDSGFEQTPVRAPEYGSGKRGTSGKYSF